MRIWLRVTRGKYRALGDTSLPQVITMLTSDMQIVDRVRVARGR